MIFIDDFVQSYNEFELQLSDRLLNMTNIKVRPNASNGLWVAFLLPACLCLTTFRLSTSDIYNLTASCSIALCVASILFILYTSASNQAHNWKSWFLPAVLIILMDWTMLGRGILFSTASGFWVSLTFTKSLIFVFRNCPLSFTVGEGLLVVQSLTLFVYSSILNIYKSWEVAPVDDIDIITLILQVGLLATIFLVWVLYVFQLHNDHMSIIVAVGGYFLFILVTLRVLLKRDSIIWILTFLNETNKIWMVTYWGIASALGGLAVTSQIVTGSKATTSHRKIFHILAIFVYITGLIHECQLIYLASGIALAILIGLETVRKLKIGIISTLLEEGFILFSDEKDCGGISLTPLYLLIGMSCPLALSSIPCTSSSLLNSFSGILSVGIGDTCASFFGSKFGKHYWPGTKKTIEGTIASVSFQYLTLCSLIVFDFVKWNFWSTLVCLVAVIINSVVEAKTNQVDNLTLPLITYSLLLLA